jgi:hypothetical protein
MASLVRGVSAACNAARQRAGLGFAIVIQPKHKFRVARHGAPLLAQMRDAITGVDGMGCEVELVGPPGSGRRTMLGQLAVALGRRPALVADGSGVRGLRTVRLLDAHQIDLLRRRFALAQRSLPRDEFPNLIESAEDTAEVWLTDPNHWWRHTVDLIIFGLERMLERSRDGSRPEGGAT